MANWQTQYIGWQADGEALATSVTLSADGVIGAAVTTGRGRFDINFSSAALTDTGVGFDIGLIIVQANTVASTSVWAEIGNLVLGDATGRGDALTTVTNAVISVINQDDNQIRLYGYVQGSTTIMTCSAKIYPASARTI